MFESFLDPILSPLLVLPTLWGMILISFVISLIITIVYKYTTDQKLMKSMKEEMKDLQKKVKDSKGLPEKAMEHQKRIMEINMKYMVHSLKPTLFTLIPILILFGWLNTHFTYLPIQPNEQFTTTMVFSNAVAGTAEIVPPTGIQTIGDSTQTITNNQAKWTLKGNAGEYLLEYKYENQSYTKDVLITNKQGQYKPVSELINKDNIKEIRINNEKNLPLNLYVFGWKLGWFGTYFIFTILFTLVLRKLLDVY